MTTINLGELDLVSTTGHCLTLSSRADFSRTTGQDTTLLTALTHPDTAHRPWVVSSGNFRMELLLSFSPEWQSPVLQERLSARLATALGEAEQWMPFGLRPTGVESSARVNHRATQVIRVSLASNHQPEERSRKRAHKLLDSGIALLNFLPPATAVQTCTMDGFHLEMHIARAASENQNHHASASALPSVSAATLSTMRHAPGLTEALPYNESGLVASIDTSDMDELLLDDQPENPQVQGDESLLALNSSTCSVSAVPSHEDLLDLPVVDSQHDQDYSLVSEVLQMVLTGISLAIQGQKEVPLADIHVQHKSPLRRLADLAPAVFVPTYIPFLASRAIFLPTIEHAMKRMDARAANDDSAMATKPTERTGHPGTHLWQHLQQAARSEAKKYRPRKSVGSRTASRSGPAVGAGPLVSSQESGQTVAEEFENDEAEEEDLLDDFDYAAAGVWSAATAANENDKSTWSASTMLDETPQESGSYINTVSIFDFHVDEDDQVMLNI